MRAACPFAIAVMASLAIAVKSSIAEASDFVRDIYPVLQRACFECHGPEKQRGGLRLDRSTDLVRGGDSGAVLLPGQPEKSELLRRVSLAPGDEGVMPPRGATLTAAEVQRLRAWIADGAKWTDAAVTHWAYVKPQRPKVPKVAPHPVDAFILQRLRHEGLQLAPQAPPEQLIRRLSLDLVGLPPTPQEVQQFLGDSSPHAYERLVDRLLASKEFGVRWARPWLDYARYADSHGFQRDDFRDLWPYRDWVVNALNADMPYDRFTIEQLAGDLLPQPTLDQLIATGFNRCAPTNVEAGSDPEETRINQVHDRINTLGMVWLGTTLECAQCHDHKYDPFTQRDYYGLFAFFNNTALEADRSNPKAPGSIRFIGPTLSLPDPNASERQAQVTRLASLRDQLTQREKALAQAEPDGEATLLQRLGEPAREHVLTVTAFDTLSDAAHEILPDGSVLLSGEVPDKDTYTVTAKTTLGGIQAIKLEALTDPSLPGKGPGRGDAKRPNFVLNRFEVTAQTGSAPAKAVRFTQARADFSQAQWDVTSLLKDLPKSGWAIAPKFHEPHWAIFTCQEPIGQAGQETTLTFQLIQNFGAGRVIGRLRLCAITGQPQSDKTIPADVIDALRTPAERRTPNQNQTLARFRQQQDPECLRLRREISRLEAEGANQPTPTTLIMKELPTPRPTMIFQRGDFRTPGATVAPSTPRVLHPFKSGNPTPNRLDLARWLVSPDNPLAARVAVNRIWAELFGHGIVATLEDFGIKGEPPTHPELLDWLACEFMHPSDGSTPWSFKHILRVIVTSQTYRQSSCVTPQLLAKDDRNRLYARGPRVRLDAETIRDNALAIAGLLSTRQGGPPIRPYQPDGLWVKVGGMKYDYIVSPGEEKYRRGLYVVWKRAAPYPSFVNFDANARMACRVQRPRSNTPQQALTLLNDPVYVEAAVAFARRVIQEKPMGQEEDRIRHAFLLALARLPSKNELAVLRQLFEAQRKAGGEAPRLKEESLTPPGVSPAEFAAWYAVCTAILNLDETITKN